MRRQLLIPAIAAVILNSWSATSAAQITVNRSVIEFSGQSKVQDIEVFNAGNHKVYLDLKAAEIINPESDQAERVELEDPRTSPLIVSPRQLLVPSGERRRMRVVLRQPAVDKDRVFRLAVKPYAGSIKIDDAGNDKKFSAIKVLVGYDLLLLSRPAAQRAELDVERDHNSITFYNKGNTNVLLRKIEQCNDAGLECESLQPNRLYAGETYRVPLPKSGDADTSPVSVWQSVGLNNSRVDY